MVQETLPGQEPGLLETPTHQDLVEAILAARIGEDEDGSYLTTKEIKAMLPDWGEKRILKHLKMLAKEGRLLTKYVLRSSPLTPNRSFSVPAYAAKSDIETNSEHSEEEDDDNQDGEDGA